MFQQELSLTFSWISLSVAGHVPVFSKTEWRDQR